MEEGDTFMELSLLEKQFIETQVSALLTQYGYNPEKDTYVDIISFAKKFGFLVGNAVLDEQEDGFIIIHPKNANSHKQTTRSPMASERKIIGVNMNRSLEWKRFVIAHEFAHSVLHYKQEDIYLHRETTRGRSQEENDADYFAAALLMPQNSFRRIYNELVTQGLNKNTICYQLASMYKVPFESVSRRIDEVCVTKEKKSSVDA